jgi:hypothetical protein
MSDRIEDVDTALHIEDGRVSMQASVTKPLRVDTPDGTPLASIQTHATLRLGGQDAWATVDLDRDQLADLHAALTDALESHGDEPEGGR